MVEETTEQKRRADERKREERRGGKKEVRRGEERMGGEKRGRERGGEGKRREELCCPSPLALQPLCVSELAGGDNGYFTPGVLRLLNYTLKAQSVA